MDGMIHQVSNWRKYKGETKMKTLQTMILSAGAVVLLGSGGLNAQTLATAQIPFAFSAQNTTLPAGEYTVSSASTSHSAMVIRNVETRKAIFVVAQTGYRAANEKNVVVFHRVGDRYFLAGVKTNSIEATVSPSKLERELESEGSGQPMAAVIVPALNVR
jgi:hypothetical protein